MRHAGRQNPQNLPCFEGIRNHGSRPPGHRRNPREPWVAQAAELPTGWRRNVGTPAANQCKKCECADFATEIDEPRFYNLLGDRHVLGATQLTSFVDYGELNAAECAALEGRVSETESDSPRIGFYRVTQTWSECKWGGHR